MIGTAWRIVAWGVAGLVVIGLLLWWLIASIEPATYIAMQDELELVGDWLLWAAALGQTAFVVTWVTMPWWTHWVGRALMVKSLALMIYLDIALVLARVDYFYGLHLLATILFGFIVIGIYTQLITLLHEATRKNGRPSRETEPPMTDLDESLEQR